MKKFVCLLFFFGQGLLLFSQSSSHSMVNDNTSSQKYRWSNSELLPLYTTTPNSFLKPKDKWIYIGWSLGYNRGESNVQAIIASLRCEIYPVIPVFVGFKALGLMTGGFYPALSVDLGVSPFKNKNRHHKGLYASANLYFANNSANYYSIRPLGGTIGYQFKAFFIESPVLIFNKTDWLNGSIDRPIFGLHFGWMF